MARTPKVVPSLTARKRRKAMRAVEALSPEGRALEERGNGVTVVTLSRAPRPLASLLQSSVFNIARAGEPSPFATRRGRQTSS